MRNFMEWVLVILVTSILMVAIGGTVVGVIGFFINRNIQSYIPIVQSKKADLQAFVIKHGDVVTIIGLQDETKWTTGKHAHTYGRTFHRCRFDDGYVIEIQQHHGEPTQRIPMDGDRWRLGIWTSNYDAGFSLYELVEPPPAGSRELHRPPAPITRQLAKDVMGSLFRRPRTTQERRWWDRLLGRLSRSDSPKRLPDSYMDVHRTDRYDRTWKRHRDTQYKPVEISPAQPEKMKDDPEDDRPQGPREDA